MQQWEYQTVTLFPVVGISKYKGWKLKAINEENLPDWRRAEKYSTLTIFCDKMGQQGWELVSALNLPDASLFLYFKRPCVNETL